MWIPFPEGECKTVAIEQLARKVTALPPQQFMPFSEAYAQVGDRLGSRLLAARDLTQQVRARRLTIAVWVIWPDGSEQRFILRPGFWRWYEVVCFLSSERGGVARVRENPVRLFGRWHWFVGRRRFDRCYSTTLPSKPVMQKQKPAGNTGTLKAWLPGAVKRWPFETTDTGGLDYIEFLQSKAPEDWTRHYFQTEISLLRKAGVDIPPIGRTKKF
jgi:hypothetical protein